MDGYWCRPLNTHESILVPLWSYGIVSSDRLWLDHNGNAWFSASYPSWATFLFRWAFSTTPLKSMELQEEQQLIADWRVRDEVGCERMTLTVDISWFTLPMKPHGSPNNCRLSFRVICFSDFLYPKMVLHLQRIGEYQKWIPIHEVAFLELTGTACKWMVGRRLFSLWKIAYFQGYFRDIC